MLFPVFDRAHAIESQLYSLVVIIINVLIQCLYEGIRRLERFGIQEFRFHYAEEVFRHRIVKAVPLARHALHDVVFGKALAIAAMLVLPPLVGMQDETVNLPAFGERLLEHVVDLCHIGFC